MSVTILKRHQDQAAEHIHSFDITDPTFEKEILSELIAYGEEDDTGEDENDGPSPEFRPYDDDAEGPNLHVEERQRLSTSAQQKKPERSVSAPICRPRLEQNSLHS